MFTNQMTDPTANEEKHRRSPRPTNGARARSISGCLFYKKDGGIPDKKSFKVHIPCWHKHPGFCAKASTPEMEAAEKGLIQLLHGHAQGTLVELHSFDAHRHGCIGR